MFYLDDEKFLNCSMFRGENNMTGIEQLFCSWALPCLNHTSLPLPIHICILRTSLILSVHPFLIQCIPPLSLLFLVLSGAFNQLGGLYFKRWIPDIDSPSPWPPSRYIHPRPAPSSSNVSTSSHPFTHPQHPLFFIKLLNCCGMVRASESIINTGKWWMTSKIFFREI